MSPEKSSQFSKLLNDCINEIFEANHEGLIEKFSVLYHDESGAPVIETGISTTWAGEIFVTSFAKSITFGCPYLMIWKKWEIRPTDQKNVFSPQMDEIIYLVENDCLMSVGNNLTLAIPEVRLTKILPFPLFCVGATESLREIRNLKWHAEHETKRNYQKIDRCLARMHSMFIS